MTIQGPNRFVDKPRALDLFCGAGGASMGLHRAGFDVTGVDKEPQPNYQFRFFQDDAMEFPLEGFDFIWASPPCQKYTWSARRWKHKERVDLVAPTRDRLKPSGIPFIIENVPGSPLVNFFRLCGTMFGLNVIRHRHFELGLLRPFLLPHHRRHQPPIIIRGKIRSAYACVAGHGGEGHTYRLDDWKTAMGIDWMAKEELVEAIPPAYSEFIGKQALAQLRRTA